MSDWVPAGSVPYDTAFADGPFRTAGQGDGSVAYFSTVAYKPPKTRDKRMCVGKDNTCKAWKSTGSDLCAGHTQSKLKEDEGRVVLSLLGLAA